MDDSTYSEYDDQTLYDDDCMTVVRYSQRRWYEEVVSDSNLTTSVYGLYHGVLDDDLDEYVDSGYLVEVDGTYYTTDHEDIQRCSVEDKYALCEDTTNIDGDYFTYEYIEDNAEEFRVKNGEVTHGSEGTTLEVAYFDRIRELTLATLRSANWTLAMLNTVRNGTQDSECIVDAVMARPEVHRLIDWAENSGIIQCCFYAKAQIRMTLQRSAEVKSFREARLADQTRRLRAA
jgi:hypothetical protein